MFTVVLGAISAQTFPNIWVKGGGGEGQGGDMRMITLSHVSYRFNVVQA